jgi:UDP-2,3-diacylglucosamine hydrolase
MSPAVPSSKAHIAAQHRPVLQAPAAWQLVDFISDLHLQSCEPATFKAWENYMQTTRADAVFILGDLFEVWIGDDAVAPEATACFETRCAQVLQAAAQRLNLFFIHGNRDFLLGPAFAKTCGMTLLTDPTALDFAGQRWLLSHGDALCLADTDYQPFRSLVRSNDWQQDFLAKPLPERQTLARALRSQSETRKRSGASYADVDSEAACNWLQAAQSSTLIHGHTHQPADHELSCHGLHMRRLVLSDWDASAVPPRAQVLRLSRCNTAGYTLQRLAAEHAA